jgi:hypothetical protein
MTIGKAFFIAGLMDNPGYESLFFASVGDTSDLSWFRYDPNNAENGRLGIAMFGSASWVPIEDCPNLSVEDCDLLNGIIPEMIPLNELPLNRWVLDKLPAIVEEKVKQNTTRVESQVLGATSLHQWPMPEAAD